MKILMIGGTGFISSTIVKRILDENYELTILTRGYSEIKLFKKEKVTIVKGDRHDKEFLKKLALENQFDVVYDMIAYTASESQMIVEVFGNKVSRLIHASTVSVYMVSDKPTNPITEDQDKLPLMNYWERNPFGMQYGIDKRKCEDVLWEAHNSGKFAVSMIRAPFVCGSYDPLQRDYFWIQRILDGKPLLIPGSGDYAFQNVFVEDLSKAFIDLLKNDVTIGNAYNIASEEIYSLNDYLDLLCELLGKTPERIYVDLDVFEKLSFSKSSEGDAFPYNTYRTAIFSIENAKMDLNFTPTPFNVWMPKVIDFHLNILKQSSVGYLYRVKELDFIDKWKQAKLNFKKSFEHFIY